MESEILTDESLVKGQIYIMENTITLKKYVGQTITHRKNRSKYRPFGYIGRFKDHLSEAICNTKKKQCRYLNNAIRSYGKDAFKVSLLHTCPRNELDTWEQHYIQEHISLYPNGYNLTTGGKTLQNKKAPDVVMPEPNVVGVRGGCSSRSEETRTLISQRLKKICSTEEYKKRATELTQQQHLTHKLERFRGDIIDLENIHQYIRKQNTKNGPKVKIIINKKTACFVGKQQSMDELVKRAEEFIQQIATTATLSNCSGNP